MLTTDQVSKKLGVAANTVAKWRLSGTGPKFVKLGSKVAYREADVEEWLQQRTFTSTSQC